MPDRDHILYAFAIEPTHDRATLERYLRLYPDAAEDLIDLSLELRLMASEQVGQLTGPGRTHPARRTG